MKYTQKITLIIILLIITSILSCKKEKDLPTPKILSTNQQSTPISIYEGTWSNSYPSYWNIDQSNVFNYYTDCNTLEEPGVNAQFHLLNDTLWFYLGTYDEWFYTSGDDTLWSGFKNQTPLTYHIKCK